MSAHGAGRVDPALRKAALFELAMAAGIVVFWALFFAGRMAPTAGADREMLYRAFESAFPPADIALAIALAIGGVALLRRAAAGPSLSFAAAGALVFLGLLDVSFNLQHGVYAAMPLQAAVNAACLAGGVWLGMVVWRHREAPRS